MRTSDVFELLRDGTPRTRAQLADASGLARSTIAARIDVLMRLGLVAPYGGGVSTGGRPPSLLAMNPRARVVAGVDIGASHATAGLADLAGTVLAERRADLDVATGPEHVLGWAEKVIGELLDDQKRSVAELSAIGIGLPGPVEHSTGRAINPPIMPGWDRYDVPAHVQGAYDVPVLIDNDVNIMALGEQHAHLPDVQDLVFIKVSTGIGAGLISGGELQRGAQGTAGDLGHVRVVRADGVICRCGNEGCLEAIAAGPALARALQDAGVAAADRPGRRRSRTQRRPRRRSGGAPGRPRPRRGRRHPGQRDQPVGDRDRRRPGRRRREPDRRHPRGRLPALPAPGHRAPHGSSPRRPASGPVSSEPPPWPSATCSPPSRSTGPASR